MAKKKQLAGKKTKLAKLPLTRALAGHAEEASPWGPSPAPAPSAPQTLAPEPTNGPLAAAYLELVHELASLRSQLGPDALPFSEPTLSQPSSLTEPLRLRRVLRLARKGLQDLHRLLSRD